MLTSIFQIAVFNNSLYDWIFLFLLIVMRHTQIPNAEIGLILMRALHDATPLGNIVPWKRL